MADVILEAVEAGRTFRRRGISCEALRGVDLRVGAGEFHVIRGRSGSGKSTLLLLLGGLRRPTRGQVFLGGQDLYGSSPSARRALCAGSVSMVFQASHLVPYLTAEANVALSLRRLSRGEALARARAFLDRVGLAERGLHLPAELSVGERQRVALARALLPGPQVILADEPTGNLDPETGELVLGELDGFRRAGGAVVLATHEPAVPVDGTVEHRITDGTLTSAVEL